MTGSLHSEAYKRFLRRLRQARKEAGLTQVDVAKAFRTDQGMISRSETGERRVDAVELAQFAKLYRKPMEWFVE